MEPRTVVALIPLMVLSACSAAGDTSTLSAADPPAPASSAASSAGSASPGAVTISQAEAEQLVRRLRAFAREPTPERAEQLPFAARVQLGLGDVLVKEVASAELADPAAWSVPTTAAYRWTGEPFLDVLDRLTGDEAYATSIGPHPHCASPAREVPPAVADHDHVSTQPSQATSCPSWYSVDLFVSEGEIRAVTLDLWEP